MADLPAVTLTLSGLPAVAAILLVCAVACSPVWVASVVGRDWMLRRIERSFRRRMAELGSTPDEIDRAWVNMIGNSGP